jgi:hypothetical protein
LPTIITDNPIYPTKLGIEKPPYYEENTPWIFGNRPDCRRHSPF